MRKCVVILAALSFLAACARLPISPVRVRGVGPQEAARLLRQTGALPVDVRSPAEYSAVRIDGALSLPPERFWEGLGELPADLEAPIVVYDARGKLSLPLAIRIMKQGYNRVYELRGGLEAWREEGLPVVAPGRVKRRWPAHA